MKQKTRLPLFAISLATVTAIGAPDLFCTTAFGQAAAGSPSLPSTAQQAPDASDQAKSDVDLGNTEVLSDTRGVNFNPYLKEILRTIYGHWTGLLPEEARTPTLAKGETDIRFTITPNGEIITMHLDASTHDVALNQAAWGAIASAQQLPPLPAAFTGPNLELRVRFRVNMEAAGSGKS